MGIQVIESAGSTFSPGIDITGGAISGFVDHPRRGTIVVVLHGLPFGKGGNYTTSDLGPSSPTLDMHASALQGQTPLQKIKPGEEVQIGSFKLRGY